MSEPDFGVDLSCDGDLDPGGAEVTGFLLKAQAIARRLDTPAGTLIGDEEGDYGESLKRLISIGMTADELAAIPARVSNQVKLEDGIISVETVATFTLLPEPTLTLDLKASCAEGPFEFTLEVTKVRTVLLRVAEGAT